MAQAQKRDALQCSFITSMKGFTNTIYIQQTVCQERHVYKNKMVINFYKNFTQLFSDIKVTKSTKNFDEKFVVRFPYENMVTLIGIKKSGIGISHTLNVSKQFEQTSTDLKFPAKCSRTNLYVKFFLFS